VDRMVSPICGILVWCGLVVLAILGLIVWSYGLESAFQTQGAIFVLWALATGLVLLNRSGQNRNNNSGY